jgi:hypothetical protein
VTYWPPTVDVHCHDPHWDYDEEENPRPGTDYHHHAALIRDLPAQRVPVGENEKEDAR